jgi:hypothetical protein
MAKPTRLKNMGLILLMEHYLGQYAHMFEFEGGIAQCYSEEIGLVLYYIHNEQEKEREIQLWMAISPPSKAMHIALLLPGLGGHLQMGNGWSKVGSVNLADPDGREVIVKRIKWLAGVYPALKAMADNPPEEWLQ